MFKYKISKEIFKPELGYVSSSFFISKDDKEILEKLKFIDLEKIKRQVVEAWQKRKEEIENTGLEEAEMLPVIYSPFLVRVPLFDPQKPPEELIFLEVEYYPINELLRLIQEKVKRINIDINKNIKLSKSNKLKRVVLQQYSPKIKKWQTILNTSKKNQRLLEVLVDLVKSYRED